MPDIKPIRIRLELKDEYLSDYQKRMLKRYGESCTDIGTWARSLGWSIRRG